jgi:hypothetical protein
VLFYIFINILLIFNLMMVEINVILSLFFFVVLSFFDFIVFNEEILLTLCFLSFLFYCFNTLSESISSSFEARAAKFEDDLLSTFASSKNILVADFNTHLKMQNFVNKFSILMTSLIHYLSVCVDSLESKSASIYFQTSLTKLNELALANRNFISVFQKACVTQLLYSLILKKSTNDLTFLTSTVKTPKKLAELKNICLV